MSKKDFCSTMSLSGNDCTTWILVSKDFGEEILQNLKIEAENFPGFVNADVHFTSEKKVLLELVAKFENIKQAREFSKYALAYLEKKDI